MQPTFAIRPLTTEDEPFLWEMLYLAIYVPDGQPLPPHDIVREPSLAHYVERWGQRAGDLGLAVLAPGQSAPGLMPVGAAWLRLFTEQDKGYGFVDEQTPELSIAVLPAYRGQGLGKLLLDNILGLAREKFAAVSLSVSPGNPAERLYRRLGFDLIAATGTSLTMIKRLK